MKKTILVLLLTFSRKQIGEDIGLSGRSKSKSRQRREIREHIATLLIEAGKLQCSSNDLLKTKDFRSELGLDSLDLAFGILEIERYYHCKINDRTMKKPWTVESICEQIPGYKDTL